MQDGGLVALLTVFFCTDVASGLTAPSAILRPFQAQGDQALHDGVQVAHAFDQLAATHDGSVKPDAD
jgi:hypothetical protein